MMTLYTWMAMLVMHLDVAEGAEEVDLAAQDDRDRHVSDDFKSVVRRWILLHRLTGQVRQ